MKRYQMWIDGAWEDADGGTWTEVVNPANEEIIAEVPLAGMEDLQRAVRAASVAQRSWRRVPAAERARYINEAANHIQSNHSALAHLIVAEQGKPLREAQSEVDGTVFLLHYAAEWARRIEGDVLPSDQRNESILIVKVPHGVVAALTPWNYPAAVPARKIGLALVTGNAVILKPHEETPLSALALGQAFEAVNLPSGLLNILTGTGEDLGASLVRHEGVQFISMTGSVEAGKHIFSGAAAHLTPVSLELGGKAPFIVFDDANIDWAVEHAIRSRFTNCGQVCICNERTYVHERIFDEFIEKYVRAAKGLRIGDPLREDTDIGPKVSRAELDKVHRMVVEAQNEGATALLGGQPLRDGEFGRGYWFPPTVLVDVRQEMAIVREEVFGPVSPVQPFADFDEAIHLANDSKYGLSAYLFTNNFHRIMRAIEDVDFGELYVNRAGPESFHAYHSGYRQSGVGGEDGKYGLDQYLLRKTIYLNYGGE